MPLQSLTTASTLYRGTSLTLEQAATQCGLAPSDLASYLRSQGLVAGDTADHWTADGARN